MYGLKAGLILVFIYLLVVVQAWRLSLLFAGKPFGNTERPERGGYAGRRRCC